MENIVFVELLRRGYNVRVGCYRDSEVDFLAMCYDRVEYIQVCQTPISNDTIEREIRPLMRPKANYPKTVLTLDRFGLGDKSMADTFCSPNLFKRTDRGMTSKSSTVTRSTFGDIWP